MKMALVPEAVHRFSAIPTEIPTALSAKMDELIPKFMWKCGGLRVAQTILEKWNESFPAFKI